MSNTTTAGLDETTVEFQGKSVRVTREAARSMGASLIERLRESEADLRDALLPQVQNLHAWIDYDGNVRIGRWLLGNTFGTLAFVLRPAPDSESGPTQYAAPVRFTNRAWIVDPVRKVRVIPSQRR